MLNTFTSFRQSKNLVFSLGSMIVLSGMIGCQRENFSQQQAHSKSKTTQQEQSSANNKPAIPPLLKVASWGDIQKRVMQHRGKIVVVNIWLTTCETCLEEFPHFLELQKRYGKQNLVCLSLNGDYDGVKEKPPEYYRADIEKFLAKQSLPAEHYFLNQSFLEYMELVDLGSTPAIFVYSDDGELIKRFENVETSSDNQEFTIKDVTHLIDNLLKSEG